MTSSLQKLLLAAVFVGLLESNASAGDTPPPGKYIEVEIEPDTGTGTPPPLLYEATIEKYRKRPFKPDKKSPRIKIPMMYRYIPPAESGPILILI
jgi:hypothetical protein